MFAPLLALALACADADPPVADPAPEDTAAVVPGALELAFQLDLDLVPDMDGPPLGPILGAVYAEADGTATGPAEGAVPLYDYVTDPLDLSDGGATDVLEVTPELEEPVVWLLACLDGDGNGCDCGDPVTIPNANKARVVGGVTTPIVVTFDLLHPC